MHADIAGIPGDIVLADSAYGDCADFRNAVRGIGFDFAVGVKAGTKVVRLNKLDRPYGEPMSVARLIQHLGPKAFRRVTWRHGTQGTLSARFCFVRVKTLHDDGLRLADREPLWLVAEQPGADDSGLKFVLTTLPRRMTKRNIVCLFKERWRTERMYEDLKGELGLDHFEGRSFAGWHHHVTVVLCCFAFVVAERARAFPPLGRPDQSGPSGAARGLSATSPTPLSLHASLSLASSFDGFPAARFVSHPTPTTTRSQRETVTRNIFSGSQAVVLGSEGSRERRTPWSVQFGAVEFDTRLERPCEHDGPGHVLGQRLDVIEARSRDTPCPAVRAIAPELHHVEIAAAGLHLATAPRDGAPARVHRYTVGAHRDDVVTLRADTCRHR